MHTARWYTGLASLLGIVSFGAVALAQESTASAEPASQPSARSSQTACFPECREGYVCARGQCVSLCNPPCAAGEICVEGKRCEALPPGGVYEPPPPPPPPKNALDRDHDMLGLHLGLGGSVDENSASRDLATTYGATLRMDFPVVRYLLIGPLFQFAGWRRDIEDATYDYYTDVDFYLRGRVPIPLGGEAGAEFWAGVPIGLTLSFLGPDRTDQQGLSGFSAGWNVGVMLGGAILFTRKFGLFTEVGWMQHKVHHESESTGFPDVTFTWSQTLLNVGFVL
jgi:hypothetical protein